MAYYKYLSICCGKPPKGSISIVESIDNLLIGICSDCDNWSEFTKEYIEEKIPASPSEAGPLTGPFEQAEGKMKNEKINISKSY